MSDQPVETDETVVVVVPEEPVQILVPFQMDWDLGVEFDFRPDALQNIEAGIKAGPVDETAPKELVVAPALKTESPLLTEMVSAQAKMKERMMTSSSVAPSVEPATVVSGTAPTTPTLAKIDMSEPL